MEKGSVSPSTIPSITAVSTDEDRLVVMYSPMRPKSVNPENWDKKTRFWIKAIEEFVQYRLTFTMTELQDAFTVSKRVPACLPDVIEHLFSSKDIVFETEVIQMAYEERNSSGWGYWPKKSLRWCLSKVGTLNPLSYWKSEPMHMVTKRFVHIKKLKTSIDKVVAIPELQNKILTQEQWKQLVTQSTQLQNDDELLFEFMKASGQIVVDTVGSAQIVKTKSNSTKETLSITEVEKKQFDVRRTKEVLEADVEKIQSKLQERDILMRQALREGKRMTAKHHLRIKKSLELRTEKVLNLVDNLSTLLLKIEDANTDVMIISAYESGKNAIDLILKENNLSSDRVTETILDLQDVLEKQNEITEAVSQPLVDEEGDAADLDAELELLLKQDQQDVQDEENSILKQLEGLKMDDLEDLNTEKQNIKEALSV